MSDLIDTALARKLRDAAFSTPRELLIEAADRIDQLTAERDEYKAECERMREGLTKLQDCDFVITPADRMDAVRKIARDTLNKENTND